MNKGQVAFEQLANFKRRQEVESHSIQDLQ